MFTSVEAAASLGVSHTYLVRLCERGRIESSIVDGVLCVPADEVERILAERELVKQRARQGVETMEERRRARAAKAAGL